MRFGSARWATIAAAAYLLNPATIFISSYWGQVDSVATGFTLLALVLVLYADRWGSRAPYAIAAAWLSLGYAVLVKPQGALIGVLFLAYPFAAADPVVRRRRLAGTALGLVGAVVLADLLMRCRSIPERRSQRCAGLSSATNSVRTSILRQHRQRVQPLRGIPPVLAAR